MPNNPLHQSGFVATEPSQGAEKILATLRMPRASGRLSAREPWIANASEEVLDILESKSRFFLDRFSYSSLSIIEVARQKRYAFIERLFSEQCPNGDRAGRELLRWISTGYIREFVRQTENNIPPLNIANAARPQPEAERYWARQPRGALEREAEHGVRHSALAYDALRDDLFRGRGPQERKLGRKIALDTTAEIIRTSIDLFRVRGREFFKDVEIRASIYNDHLFIVEYAKRCLTRSRAA